MIWSVLVVALALALCASSSLISVDRTKYEYKLTQSVTGFTIWTTANTNRLYATSTTPPSNAKAAVTLTCAREELESFQVIVAPTSAFATMTVTMAPFPGLGPTATIDVGKVGFTPNSQWAFGGKLTADYTDKVAPGGSVTLSTSQPTILWITLYVPGAGTSAGDKSTTLTLTPNGASPIVIPINLHVYNFILDRTPHFSSILSNNPSPTDNTSIAGMDVWKEAYLKYRVQNTDMSWPWRMDYDDTYVFDCPTKTIKNTNGATATVPCGSAGACQMKRYNLGKGGTWRGVTFSDWIDRGFSTCQFQYTADGLPPSVCGVACNTAATSWAGNSIYNGWMCTKAYEDQWGAYLKAMQDYLTADGYFADIPNVKGYWYTINEPRSWEENTIAAYLCSLRRRYAPNLPIMTSAGATPDLAERSDFGNCSYDIWMAHVNMYQTAYTMYRQSSFGETSWFYSIDADNRCRSVNVCATSFAPAVSDTGSNAAENAKPLNEGMHYRIIPWVGWANRITGWYYYNGPIYCTSLPLKP